MHVFQISVWQVLVDREGPDLLKNVLEINRKSLNFTFRKINNALWFKQWSATLALSLKYKPKSQRNNSYCFNKHVWFE